MTTGFADLLKRRSTASLLTKSAWLGAANPPTYLNFPGSYLAFVRISASLSIWDEAPMVTCIPLGSALLTQSLRAITPPAPGLFRTSRAGCPGRWCTRLRPRILPYRSGLSPAPNPMVMVTGELMASCAAARWISPAHAELATTAQKITKEAVARIPAPGSPAFQELII